MENRKPGRPPKDPSGTKGERIEIRVAPAERQSIDAAATAAGLERSDWMRDRLLKAAKREKA
jgi:uncharacterized protein (DUF1778 family)